MNGYGVKGMVTGIMYVCEKCIIPEDKKNMQEMSYTYYSHNNKWECCRCGNTFTNFTNPKNYIPTKEGIKTESTSTGILCEISNILTEPKIILKNFRYKNMGKRTYVGCATILEDGDVVFNPGEITINEFNKYQTIIMSYYEEIIKCKYCNREIEQFSNHWRHIDTKFTACNNNYAEPEEK